ncbi:hypothetical protein D9M71_50160 [compost metagenome]
MQNRFPGFCMGHQAASGSAVVVAADVDTMIVPRFCMDTHCDLWRGSKLPHHRFRVSA